MPNPEDSLVQYAPLVRKLALQLLARLPSSVQLDDLVQAGMIGLLDAVRRYQESPDAQFETYATARIRGAMLDELRRALIDAIDGLPEREKLLLSLCYEQGLNLKEIGAVLNVTEARVCQLRAQATARIRARLKEQAWARLPTAHHLAQVV